MGRLLKFRYLPIFTTFFSIAALIIFSINSFFSPVKAQSEPLAQTGLVGQFGGLVNAIQSEGTTAYIGIGPRLVVADVSNESQPVVLGRTTPLPGIITDIKAIGNYAYVAVSRHGLRVIDVSNPELPKEVGFIDKPGYYAEAIDVSGSYAFVAAWSKGVLVVDISNPTSPQEVALYSQYTNVHNVKVFGNLLYVAAGTDGLKIFNISSPTSPVEIGSYMTSSSPTDASVVGNFAYVTDWLFGLRILDVSNPASPFQVGSISLGISTNDVTVRGNYAYVADWASGLHIIDIQNPNSPQEIGRLDSDEWIASRVSLSDNNLALVTTQLNGLRIVDIENPSAPAEVGLIQSLGQVKGVAVSGELAYLIDEAAGLRIVNVADPTDPQEVGFFDSPGSFWNTIALSGQYAFLGTNSGLYISDVSIPSSPAQVGFYQAWVSNNIVFVGNYAYVPHGNQLMILDVSNPTSPTLVGVAPANGAEGVAVSGNYAYVADADGLRIFDISSPSSPIEVGVLDTPGYAWRVEVDKDIAYIADMNGGLRVINVSNPSSPTEIGYYANIGNTNDIEIYGGNAYVSNTDGFIMAFDISDPTRPALMTTYNTPGGIYGITVTNGLIYVAGGGAGLEIIALSPQGGSISGFVTDKATGQPMGGGAICVNDPITWAPVGDCQPVAANGKYRIYGLPNGNYHVHSEAPPGYAKQVWENTFDWGAFTPVPVEAPNDTPNINFSLEKGGDILVQVKDTNGNNITGAQVSAGPYDKGGSGGWGGWMQSDGTYIVNNLLLGDYWVQVQAQGYVSQYYDGVLNLEGATRVALTENQNPFLIVVMQQGGSITGTVRDEQQNPLPGVNVCLGTYDTAIGSGCYLTQADGTYRIEGLPTEDYRVEIGWPPPTGYAHMYFRDTLNYNQAEPVTVTAPNVTTNIDFHLVRAGSITGVVHNAITHELIQGGNIRAEDYYTGQWKGSGDIVDGNYSISGLPTGDYYVIVEPPTGYAHQVYAGVFNWQDATPVHVNAPDTTSGIDFSLPPGGRILGRVTDTDGNPVSGVTVIADLYDTDKGWGFSTDADGYYEVKGLIEGQYRVRVESGAGLATTYYVSTLIHDEATPVPVTPPGDSTANITMLRGGSISGLVTDKANSQPLGGGTICVDYPPPEGGNVTCQDVNPDGSYQVIGIPTGDYHVHIEPPTGYGWQIYKDTTDWNAYTPVPVEAPYDTPGIDFSLAQVAYLTGRVTDAETGAPVPNAHLVTNGEGYRGYACTDTNGLYQVDGIPLNIPFKLSVGLTPCDDSEQIYPRMFWENGKDSLEATPISTTVPGNLGEFNFALHKGSYIEGMVYDENGQPLSGVWVGASRTEEWITRGGDGTQNGLFRFAAHPGDQKIFLCGESCGESFPDLFYDQRQSIENAKTVLVADGQTLSGIDFYLGGITHAGDSITVHPRPGVTLNYTQVGDGFTYASPAEPPAIPSNFELLGQNYSIQTDATFSSAQVCLSYDDTGLNLEEEQSLELSHFENDIWTNITDSGYPDTSNNLICGTVSSFSHFAVFLPLDVTPPTANIDIASANDAQCNFFLQWWIDDGSVTYDTVHGCSRISANINADTSGLDRYVLTMKNSNNEVVREKENGNIVFNFDTSESVYSIELAVWDNAGNYTTVSRMVYEDDDNDVAILNGTGGAPDMFDVCPAQAPSVDTNKDGCQDVDGVSIEAANWCIDTYTGRAQTSLYPTTSLTQVGEAFTQRNRTWYSMSSTINSGVLATYSMNFIGRQGVHNDEIHCSVDGDTITTSSGVELSYTKKDVARLVFRSINGVLKVKESYHTNEFSDGAKINASMKYNENHDTSILHFMYNNQDKSRACIQGAEEEKDSCISACGKDKACIKNCKDTAVEAKNSCIDTYHYQFRQEYDGYRTLSLYDILKFARYEL